MTTILLDRKMDINSTIVKWNASYTVGISEIDQQHRIIFSTINELNESLTQRKSENDLGEALERLDNYTQWHFAFEENMFDKYAYPWSTTHKAEHQAFARKVATLNQEQKQGKSGLTHQALNFLSDWLKNHIIGKDKTYSYFFIMKGSQ
jgi:hemerythrin